MSMSCEVIAALRDSVLNSSQTLQTETSSLLRADLLHDYCKIIEITARLSSCNNFRTADQRHRPMPPQNDTSATNGVYLEWAD